VDVVAENSALGRRIASALADDGLQVLQQTRTPAELSDGEPATTLVLGVRRGAIVALLQELRERREPPVVLVGSRAGSERLAACVRRGLAEAVVATPELDAALAPTVRAAAAGQVVLPRASRQHLGRGALSRRERDVMRLVVDGQTNDQIAAKLFLTTSTVKSHLTSAFAKLGVWSRAEASALLLDPDDPTGRGVLEPFRRFERSGD
jgi:DNA-binding NarL/FixJ family response regulator